MILLRLFYEFFKTGLFSVGGGLATLPFLYHIADRTGWFTQQDIANLLAISESTPGPIGVNAATYVGYLTAGLPGSIVATLGLLTPSIIIILIISRILAQFRESPLVKAIFTVIRPASTALIAAAGLTVFTSSILTLAAFRDSGSLANLMDWPLLILAAVLFICIQRFPKIHPAVFILISAAVGILLYLI